MSLRPSHRRRIAVVALIALVGGVVPACSTTQGGSPTMLTTPDPTSGIPTTMASAVSADADSGASTPVTSNSATDRTDSPTSPRQTSIVVVAPPTSTAGTPAGSSTGSSTTVPASSTSPASTTSTSSPAPSTTTRADAPPTTPTTKASGSGSLAGKVIVIDPGHNGQNHNHPEIINKPVPAGFGQTKPCNTTGTQTNAGYPEYTFNWKVGVALADLLRADGATVILTRDSNDGVGPCVDKRAEIGNDAHADAVVSIHGDGEVAGMSGFYVMTAEQNPAGAAMAAQSLTLAKAIRDGLDGAGFSPSNGLGAAGLWKRNDLAGLNLSLRPTVMIECGNMRNAHEASVMSSSAGQQRYAEGIAAGVVAYLAG